MTASRRLSFAWPALLAAALSLPELVSAAPPAVSYVTQKGWGNLSFEGGRFELVAMGSNGHSCTLDGPRKGDIGDAGEGCKVAFKPLPGCRLQARQHHAAPHGHLIQVARNDAAPSQGQGPARRGPHRRPRIAQNARSTGLRSRPARRGASSSSVRPWP